MVATGGNGERRSSGAGEEVPAERRGVSDRKPNRNSAGYRVGAVVGLWGSVIVALIIGRAAWDISGWAYAWLKTLVQ